eukprot:2395320-Pyramimonas_sp.AAC.2
MSLIPHIQSGVLVFSGHPAQEQDTTTMIITHSSLTHSSSLAHSLTHTLTHSLTDSSALTYDDDDDECARERVR